MEDLRQTVRQSLEPVLDLLTDRVMTIVNAMQNNVPKDLSDKARSDLINGIIKQNADSLKVSIEQAVPKDFEAKLKEAVNGGK